MYKFYSIEICLPVKLCFQMILLTLDLSFKLVLACIFKRGSHMPLTCLAHCCQHSLGHPCGICDQLSPNHDLFQAMTAGLLAKLSWVHFCRQASGCQRSKYFIWTSLHVICWCNVWHNSIFPHFYFNRWSGMKIAHWFNLHFAPTVVQGCMSGDLSEMDPLEQIAEHFHL